MPGWRGLETQAQSPPRNDSWPAREMQPWHTRPWFTHALPRENRGRELPSVQTHRNERSMIWVTEEHLKAR